jgi:hypothetical protein
MKCHILMQMRCLVQADGDVHVDIMDPHAGQYQQQLQVLRSEPPVCTMSV